jgi:phosphatidylglycerophosphate synthase
MIIQTGRRLTQLHNVLRFGKDEMLRSLVRALPLWLTPNQVTWFRTALTAVWLPFALLYPAFWQVFIFASIYFLDLLDGAMARLQDRVTLFGGMLDHTSDKLNNIAVLVLLYGVTSGQFPALLFFVAWDAVTAVWIIFEKGNIYSAFAYFRSPFELVVKIALWAFLFWQVLPILIV